MALDFIIFDHDKIVKSLPIGVDGHFYLIEIVKRIGTCPLMRRAEDYYEDTEIQVAELPLFLEEIDTLSGWQEKKECSGILRDIEKITDWDVKEAIREFLALLNQLVQEAVQLKTGIKVIAD